MSQMKYISCSQYFLDLFTNSTNCTDTSYLWVAQLPDWSKVFAWYFSVYMKGKFIVWSQKIVNLIGQYRSRESEGRFRCYTATRKLTITPAAIFSYPRQAGGLF